MSSEEEEEEEERYVSAGNKGVHTLNEKKSVFTAAVRDRLQAVQHLLLHLQHLPVSARHPVCFSHSWIQRCAEEDRLLT